MVQIFQQNPDPGTEHAQKIAQGFGGGFSQGIQQGLQAQLQGLLSKKKEVGKIRTNIGQLVKRGEKFKYSEATQNLLEKRARELVDAGLGSADEASLFAFEEYNQGLSPWLQETKNSGLAALNEKPGKTSAMGSKGKEIESQTLPPSKTQIPLNFLNEPKPPGFWQRVFQGTGGGAAMQAHALEQQREAIPQSIAGGIEGSTLGAIKLPQPETEAGQIYRELFKYGGFGKTAGRVQSGIEKITKPTGPVGKLASAAITGTTVSAAQQMINRGEIDPKELGLEAGIWTGLEGLFIVAPQIMRYFKKPIEDIAKKTGQTAEEILLPAIKDTETNFQAVLEGDSKEINKLKNRITKEAPGAEKVSKTEKSFFDKEAAITAREAHGEKLKASPFGEYFRIEQKKAADEAKKTPEVLAKEAETKARLQPEIEKIEKSIDLDRKEIKEFQKLRKEASGNTAERLNLNISAKEKAIDKKMEELKNLRYEMKYGKKRPTEAELEIAAEKSAKELVEQIRNPTPENQKALARQLELDKQFLERAEKIKNRGEFETEYIPDEHIRIMEKYSKAYEAMIDTLKDEVRSLKGTRDVQSLKRIKDNREAIKQLEARQKRHKANIVNQKDKIIALKSIEGPSGAFFKNQIRKSKNEIKEFEKDLFAYKGKPETKPEIGTSQKGQQQIKEAGKQFEKMEKVGEKVAKDPSKENINTASEATGQKPSEVKEETEKMGNLIKDRSEKVQQGKGSEKQVVETANQVNRQLSLWAKRIGKIPMNLAKGFGLGVASGLFEQYFDIKIPSSLLGALVPGGTTSRIGTGFAAGYGYKLVSEAYTKKESNKLRELRSKPLEYDKYVKDLRSRYKPARVNKILEESR